jgi:hypothetical protein
MAISSPTVNKWNVSQKYYRSRAPFSVAEVLLEAFPWSFYLAWKKYTENERQKKETD